MVAALRLGRDTSIASADTMLSPHRRLLAVSLLFFGTVLFRQPEYMRQLPTAEERLQAFRPEPHRRSILSLRDLLAEDDRSLECPEGLVPVHDSNRDLLSEEVHPAALKATSTTNTRTFGSIPKIVHVTLPSRCATESFKEAIDRWRFANYTLLLHDDQAVDRLLGQSFPEFPELSKVVHCVLTGAGKADLWRAVVLWQYGGIYVDADSAPNTKLEEGGIIQEDDQAFFVVEQGGWLSQYFMASLPNHPLMYLLISKIVQRLYSLNQVDNQYVPRSTGPGALKYAFIAFMNDQGDNIYEGMRACNGDRKYKYGTVTEGKYTGWDNRTVTVVGESGRANSNDYVIRSAVKKKGSAYAQMGVDHFSTQMERIQDASTDSCFRRIYERERLGLWNPPPNHNLVESSPATSTPAFHETVIF